ncbi:7631_t:CDS:2, partial [Racocetra fulgida]
NLPALDPHRNLLIFHMVNKSLDELEVDFNTWANGDKLFPLRDHYIYIEIRNNDVFRGPPNKTTNAKHPGPSEELHKRNLTAEINVTIRAGDGIFHEFYKRRKTCSAGFFVRSNKRIKSKKLGNYKTYVITERNYCFEGDATTKGKTFLHLPWNSNLPTYKTKSVGTMELPNFANPYNFAEIQMTSQSKIKRISERLIITDMQTDKEDLGGPVFMYTTEGLNVVDLFGIQVTSGPKLTAALSYELIHDITGYTLLNVIDLN